MPKNLFYLISADKRQKLFDAALEEFSSHLPNEASINQIIKKANISRGSFYQYFEDKEDLHFYIISSILSSKSKQFAEEIKPQTTDILSIYRSFFVLNLSLISDEKYQAFFKNLYLGMNFNFKQKLKAMIEKIRDDLYNDQFKELFQMYKSKEPLLEEFLNMLELISMDLRLIKISKNMPDEQILKLYDTRIYLLTGRIQL